MKDSFISNPFRFLSDSREKEVEIPQRLMLQPVDLLRQPGRGRSEELEGKKLDLGRGIALLYLNQFKHDSAAVGELNFEFCVELRGEEFAIELVQGSGHARRQAKRERLPLSS